MSGTIVTIDLEKVARYSEYFKYFERTGKHNDISVSFIYHSDVSSEEAEAQAKKFFIILSNLSFNGESKALIEALLKNIQFHLLLDILLYFQMDSILLGLIKYNHMQSVWVLKRYFKFFENTKGMEKIFECFIQNVPLPPIIRNKSLNFFVYTPLSKINTQIRNRVRQLEYIRSLISESCYICKEDETFPKQNFHQYFKVTNCCFVPVHEKCYKEYVIRTGECTICKIGVDTKHETIWLVRFVTSSYSSFRKKYGHIDLRNILINYTDYSGT